MSDRLIVETPEQVFLELPLAGIGSRFLALALDTLIQAALVALPLGLWGILREMGLVGSSGKTDGAAAWAQAFWVLVVFAVQFGYFAFFEAVWKGQTPGKRIIRIRVIKGNGQTIRTHDAVARNLLRIVDSLPGIYMVGILSALLSSQSKRLGDYVADTVVVHERLVTLSDVGRMNPTPAIAEASAMALTEAGRLSEEEFQLIEAFLLRRHQLGTRVREQMARQIADRVGSRLAISREEIGRPEYLLERLATAYRTVPRFR